MVGGGREGSREARRRRSLRLERDLPSGVLWLRRLACDASKLLRGGDGKWSVVRASYVWC